MLQRFHIHRYEFKYPLDLVKYPAVKRDVLNYADHDPYSQLSADKSYLVTSLYYDTPERSAFWEKINGVKTRKKFRFRVYDTDPNNKPDVYLEIKRKNNFVITKDRAKIDYDTYVKNRDGDCFSFLDNVNIPPDQKAVIEEWVYHMVRFRSEPALIVAYKREAFFGRHHHNVRITFDSQIKTYGCADLFNPHKQPDTVLSREVILELKFNGTLPGWFHRIIQKYDLSREAHSKYCNSYIKLNHTIV